MFIDLIAVLLFLYGFYVGYTRGIIKTVFAIVSIMVGILAALKLSPILINVIQRITNWHPGLSFIIGFALTFILVLIIIRFIGKKLEDIMKFAHVNFINKIAGGIVMAILLMVFYSYALWGIDSLKLISEKGKSSSMTYEYLQALPDKTEDTAAKLRPYFQEFWDKLVYTFESIKKYEEKSSAK